MLNNNVVALEDEDKRGYYVTLELYQYREGELIDKRIVEDDYMLRNLVHMYLLVASGYRRSDAVADYKIRDLTNIERSGKLGAYAWQFYSQYTTIMLGTGSNPVAVTDYKLQTKVLSQLVNDGHIWVVGNQFNVTGDSTIVSDGSYSITECGLSVGWNGESAVYYALICRDVFSAISVNNGDVIVVRYIFRFNL